MTTGSNPENFDVLGTPPPANDGERLRSIHEALGFYPQSQRELSIISSAMKGFWREGLAGASERGRYMSDVLWHQNMSKSSNPAAALHEIVSDAEGFARDTRGTKAAMLLLGDQLENKSDETLLADVNSLSDWDQPIILRALKQLQRRVAIDTHIASGSDAKLNLDTQSQKDAVAQMLARTMVFEARPIIDANEEEQVKRRKFWIEQLTLAAAQAPVALHAEQALLRLNPKQY